MTRHRSFKRLVRLRMEKAGESYTAARAVLLAGAQPIEPGEKPPLATSDERIRERTGMGWEEWFDLLDSSVAPGATHREIARWVADRLGIVPLAWNAQAITHSYEVARRGKVTGQHDDGFTATASRTIAAPPAVVFDALSAWLADAPVVERTTTRGRSARYDWTDDGSRVAITMDAKDAGTRCTVSVSHSRLPDATAYDARKAWWRERLLALEARLETGGDDA
jgi:hypothetical protein